MLLQLLYQRKAVWFVICFRISHMNLWPMLPLFRYSLSLHAGDLEHSGTTYDHLKIILTRYKAIAFDGPT